MKNNVVELDEDEAPELTPARARNLRPARTVLPAEVRAQFGKGRGRPPVANPKQAVSLRLDPEVLSAYKATGKGWQTRINQVLRNAMPKPGEC